MNAKMTKLKKNYVALAALIAVLGVISVTLFFTNSFAVDEVAESDDVAATLNEDVILPTEEGAIADTEYPVDEGVVNGTLTISGNLTITGGSPTIVIRGGAYNIDDPGQPYVYFPESTSTGGSYSVSALDLPEGRYSYVLNFTEQNNDGHYSMDQSTGLIDTSTSWSTTFNPTITYHANTTGFTISSDSGIQWFQSRIRNDYGCDVGMTGPST